jgi:hypothetical protein
MKVNIFTPTYHRFEMTKRSIISIINNVQSSIYDTTLYICDNNSPVEMKEWLLSLQNDKVKVFLNDKNIGKAEIINKVYDLNSECDYFISIDSDFIADEEYNFIDAMVWCITNFTDFGLLSTFQKENDQQLWGDLKKEQTIGSHVVGFDRYHGVAGGCIILKKDVWDLVGRYDTYGGVYGYDDALLMQAVNSKNKKVGVIKTVKLTHPFDEDKKYIEWKRYNISKRKKSGYHENS